MGVIKVQHTGALPPYPGYWYTDRTIRELRVAQSRLEDSRVLLRYSEVARGTAADWAKAGWYRDDYSECEDDTIWYWLVWSPQPEENEFGPVIP